MPDRNWRESRDALLAAFAVPTHMLGTVPPARGRVEQGERNLHYWRAFGWEPDPLSDPWAAAYAVAESLTFSGVIADGPTALGWAFAGTPVWVQEHGPA